MNTEWIDFLNTRKTVNTEIKADNPESTPSQTIDTLTAVSNLAIIEVSGKDAGLFLQGQLTCDINDLTDKNSFFSAFCNAKGRAISTFLILKHNENFLLILPTQLTEKVINKLKMYILRSDVQLHNKVDSYCLIGLNSVAFSKNTNYPEADFEVLNTSEIIIKLPKKNNRYLVVCDIDRAKQLWTELTQANDQSITDAYQWNYQDISAGLPWLDEKSSEEYIPQMLNIDKLGGISFQKGCYTGQEIIARTHYLGKAKRGLFLVECDKTAVVDTKTLIITTDSEQSVGKIIALQTNGRNYRMLAVLPTNAPELNKLSLDNSNQDKITLKDFQ